MNICKLVKSGVPLFILSGILAGCGNIATVRSFSTPYAEPVGGDIARIRIISNGMVRAVPGKTCVDWRSPGAGVMVSAQKGFADLNGRDLQMPKDLSGSIIIPKQSKIERSELRISANTPIVLNFISQGYVSAGNKYACHGSLSFVAKAGANYEALFLEQGSQCLSEIRELLPGIGQGASEVVTTSNAKLCHLSDMI